MTNSSAAGWLGAEFRKSSFSGGENGSCVEMGRVEALIGIRDSKNVSGPVLMLGEAQGWAFLSAVKRRATR